MTKVKDVLIISSCVIALSPCLLMLDKSEGVVNLVGFVYFIFVFLLSFTPKAKRIIIRCYKANLRLENDLLNLKML